MYNTYYVPSTKQRLIEALTLVYPADRSKFMRMPIAQLYAIFYKIRERSETKPKIA